MYITAQQRHHSFFCGEIILVHKGQLISKAIYGQLTSPKKRTDEFDLFAVKSKKEKKQPKQIRPFDFWEKLGDHKLLSKLTDL